MTQSAPQPLNNTTVARTPRPITVLQFGSGNFLRGFADWMIQQSNDAGLTDHGVAIAYATNRPRRHDPLAEQDGLYHVVLEGVRDGRAVRRVDLIDVVQAVVDPWADYAEYRRIALSPELKLVISNTTEAGIAWSDDDLSVRPAASFPGQVAQLLHERYEAFDGADEAGLSILCCELIEANGTTLQGYVRRHAANAGWGEDFLAWLERANRFYDTLVDRIVSGFPADEAPALQAETGFDDRALVKGELFSLWVVGGDPRIQELLPLAGLDLGVTYVTTGEVAAFRDKKVRVLNGCHTAMALAGLQLGHVTVDQAFADPDVRRYLDQLLEREVLPTIAGDPDELRAFAASILERFANPSLHHKLADIGLNSVAKWQARNLGVVRDRWTQGETSPLSELALASLLVLYSGRSEAAGFEPRDDDAFVAATRTGFDASDLSGWVARCLALLPLEDQVRTRLVDEVTPLVRRLLTDGTRETLRTLALQPLTP